MTDTGRLRALMKARGATVAKVAAFLGISPVSFRRKLHLGRFDSDEMLALAALLKMRDPASIFFASGVTYYAPIQEGSNMNYGERAPVRERLPEPPMEPPEEEVLCRCGICDGEIYRGEIYGLGDKGAVCTDCLEESWHSLSEFERFQRMGLDPLK